MSKNLMMDLLDLAQHENNTFSLNEVNFSLLRVIENAFKIVGHNAKRKQVDLKGP